MSMHLSFLTSLANQGDFPPDYSLLPGTRLSYPFLSDSISASLYQLGAPLWFAYQLPMWAAGAQVLFGLYAFFSAMTESRAQAALAWVFFAFNGGFGFFYFLGGGVENFTRIFTALRCLAGRCCSRRCTCCAGRSTRGSGGAFSWWALWPAPCP